MVYSTHNGNRFAILLFQEDGNLRMRYQAIFNQQLFDLLLELKTCQASRRDFSRDQWEADVPCVTNPYVTRKFRDVKDVNMYEVSRADRSPHWPSLCECRKLLDLIVCILGGFAFRLAVGYL